MERLADQIPPKTDKRKVRHDKKRQKLLDEAMAIVTHDGIEALTIARLAQRIRGSVGALYRYFESKEELVFGLQEMAIVTFRQFLESRASEAAIAAKAPATAPDGVLALARFMTVVTAYVDHADHSPETHRLVDHFLSTPEALLSDDDARVITERVVRPILELVGGFLARAAATGALAPGNPEQRTHLAWAFMHGLDHFRKRDRINGTHLQVKVLLPLAVRTLLSGWGAKDAELTAAAAIAYTSE